MPSPVDPSRRTALANALIEAEVFATAAQVENRFLSDLVEIRGDVEVLNARLRASTKRLALIDAIEAGEYGPYQESEA